MAVFQNIDGTTKSAFKIGPRGITLSVEASAEITGHPTIVELLADGKAVLTEDHLQYILPTQLCTGITTDDNGNLIIEMKKFDSKTWNWIKLDPIIIELKGAGTGNITGPESSTVGNFAVFDSETGDKLADKGMSKIDKMFESKRDETGKEVDREIIADAENKIPSVKAVFDYIGDISLLLHERQEGLNNK